MADKAINEVEASVEDREEEAQLESDCDNSEIHHEYSCRAQFLRRRACNTRELNGSSARTESEIAIQYGFHLVPIKGNAGIAYASTKHC